MPPAPSGCAMPQAIRRLLDRGSPRPARRKNPPCSAVMIAASSCYGRSAVRGRRTGWWSRFAMEVSRQAGNAARGGLDDGLRVGDALASATLTGDLTGGGVSHGRRSIAAPGEGLAARPMADGADTNDGRCGVMEWILFGWSGLCVHLQPGFRRIMATLCNQSATLHTQSMQPTIPADPGAAHCCRAGHPELVCDGPLDTSPLVHASDLADLSGL